MGVILKNLFEVLLYKAYKRKRPLWSKQSVNEAIKLMESYNTISKTSMMYRKCYYYITYYKVVYKNNKKALIKKKPFYKNSRIYVVPKEKMFHILKRAHLENNHCGARKLSKIIKLKYYIPLLAIEAFVNSCVQCKRLELTEEASKSVNWVESEKLESEFNYLLMQYYKYNVESCAWTQNSLQQIMNGLKNGSDATACEKLKKMIEIEIDDDGTEYLVWKKAEHVYPKLIPIDEFFEKIHEVHLQTGHGNFETMTKFLYEKFHIPKIAIQVYLDCCQKCKGSFKEFHLKYNRKTINYAANINVIDFSTESNKMWLLIYRYHETQFVRICPLSSYEPGIVALQLFEIFKKFGVPETVDNAGNTNFFKVIIDALKVMLVDWKLETEVFTNVSSRNLQINEFFRTKVKIMLAIWQSKNPDSPLELGCSYIQNKLSTPHIRPSNKTINIPKSPETFKKIADKSIHVEDDVVSSDDEIFISDDEIN